MTALPKASHESWHPTVSLVQGTVAHLHRTAPFSFVVQALHSEQRFTISLKEAQLAEIEGLAQWRTFEVMAEQELYTGRLRHLILRKVLPGPREVDTAVLERLWAQGREAWKDVPDAVAWVRDLRGNVE